MRHLRLVHNRQPILTVELLAQFATPKTWPEILALDPTMTRSEWRDAIVDADTEERGLGLLTWRTNAQWERGVWTLTDKGRDYIARRRGDHG